MLPKVLPQARIWAYDYNSNCYSDNAQEIDVLALGDTFLEVLKGYQEQGIGERMLVFIGSCFGGIVIAQVRPSLSLMYSLIVPRCIFCLPISNLPDRR